jgi:hypothetical protein
LVEADRTAVYFQDTLTAVFLADKLGFGSWIEAKVSHPGALPSVAFYLVDFHGSVIAML